MGIARNTSSKHSSSKNGNKKGRGSVGGMVLERLEGREMFSVGSAAIATEYVNTWYEHDAYGSQVYALLGSATSGVQNVPGVSGALEQTFHDNGTIYWSPSTGAHVVFGAIGAEYAATAHETNGAGQTDMSVLGLPTSDEEAFAAVSGARENTFQGGVILWSSNTGAHAVMGGINGEYSQVAHETGAWGDNVQQDIGLPTTDELATVGYAGGRVSDFQGGQIYWSAKTGAHVVYGSIYNEYSALGGSTSWLGLPTVDEFGASSARYTDFENGYISFTSAGAVAHQTAVTVGFRNGSELDVNAYGTRDVVSVSQSGSTLFISADGQTWSAAMPAYGLSVITHGGNDTVTINSGVTARTTLVSVDGSVSNLFNNTGLGNVEIWADGNDVVWGPGVIHRVTSFAGGVSKAAGAALANPSDAGVSTYRSGSLFGSGPTITDVNQGGDGDCYLMAELAGLAQGRPQEIENSVVDLGDGTYAVQFFNGVTPEYVRVNASLPGSSASSWVDAYPGASGSLWAPIVEKAYAYYKTGANTYGSINVGNVGQSTAMFDLPKESIYPSNMTDATFGAEIAKRLAQGQALTVDVATNAPDVVNDHFYTVTAIINTGNGYIYQIRNPWGTKGGHLENAQGYAWLNFSEMQANFSVADITTL